METVFNQSTISTVFTMASKPQFMFCRFCGTRLKQNAVSEHELQCLAKSEESVEQDDEQQEKNRNSNKKSKKTSVSGKVPKNVKTMPGKPNQKRKTPKSDAKSTKRNAKRNPSDVKNRSNRKYDSRTEKNDSGEMSSLPYPTTSKENNEQDIASKPYPSPSSSDAPKPENGQPRRDSLPMNAIISDEPKQAWNANTPRRLSGKWTNPFPKMKKYRYYPVSCEFCNKKFQPGPLRKHVQKYHPDAHLPPALRGKGKIAPPGRGRREKKERVKAPGGMPRQLKICYICGKLYGTKSLKIHEPKCLDKWRIENDRLPKHRRMPEPVKPEPIAGPSTGGSLPGSKGYNKNLPELDPEAEAAYQSHLRNLIPCTHCGRTFNPDRVLVHENACIERPRKKRPRKTPKKDISK